MLKVMLHKLIIERETMLHGMFTATTYMTDSPTIKLRLSEQENDM